MGLLGARVTKDAIETDGVMQLVLQEMARDPKGLKGQSTIKKLIQTRTGIHVPR